MKVCLSLINDMLQVLNEPGEGPSGIISFAQFVSFLINGTRSSRVNVELSQAIMAHSGYWTPYWKLCTPCHSDAIPTTIVKMDGGQFEQEVSQALPIGFVMVNWVPIYDDGLKFFKYFHYGNSLMKNVDIFEIFFFG